MTDDHKKEMSEYEIPDWRESFNIHSQIRDKFFCINENADMLSKLCDGLEDNVRLKMFTEKRGELACDLILDLCGSIITGVNEYRELVSKGKLKNAEYSTK